MKRPDHYPDRHDPFLTAARYNDAASEEHGFPEAIEHLGINPDTILHVAQQRALRLVMAGIPGAIEKMQADIAAGKHAQAIELTDDANRNAGRPDDPVRRCNLPRLEGPRNQRTERRDLMAWHPLTEGEPNPNLIKAMALLETGAPSVRVYQNDKYQVIRRDNESGITWLSIKRHDRRPIRDWRHLQQIKNEVCGPEREAAELFPAESRLADSANEYHLWVVPEGVAFPFGFEEGLVTNDEQVEIYNEGSENGDHKGRQRPWEPGLTTGRGENTPYMTPEQEELVGKLTPKP